MSGRLARMSLVAPSDWAQWPCGRARHAAVWPACCLPFPAGSRRARSWGDGRARRTAVSPHSARPSVAGRAQWLAPCAQCAGGRARHTAVSPTRPLRSLDARRAQRPGIVRGIGRVGGLAMSNGRPCAQWSGRRGCGAAVSPARPSRSPVARSAQRSGVMLLGRAGGARACAGAVPSVVLLAYRSSCPVIGRRQQKCCVLKKVGRASLSVGRYAMPLVRRTAVSPASCFPYAVVERAGVWIERECSPCGWVAT